MSVWVLLLACQDEAPVERTAPPEDTPEGSLCVHRELGPEGGAIEAEGVRVIFPPDMLDEPEEVSLCPAETPDDGDYSLRSPVWELDGVAIPSPVQVVFEQDDLDGAVLFMDDGDGSVRRSFEQEISEGELSGWLYRPGPFFLAEDGLVQAPYQLAGPVDLLFVVDNTCSMSEAQQQLADSFPQVLGDLRDRDLDYHVGVTSTDMASDYNGSQGKLHQVAGANYIQPETDDPVGYFEAMVSMGTYGSPIEQGLAAAYTAIELEHDGVNRYFLRDESALSIVIVSDEPDFTPNTFISDEDFGQWMLDLGESRPSVAFHSLVWATDTTYTEVTAAVGGQTADIAGSEWPSFFEGVTSEFGGFLILDPPAGEAPAAWVDPASGEEPYELPDDRVTFDRDTQRVEVRAELEVRDQIWLLYPPR
jgi:hypothetical protein